MKAKSVATTQLSTVYVGAFSVFEENMILQRSAAVIYETLPGPRPARNDAQP